MSVAPALLFALTSCARQAGEERTYAHDIHLDFRDKPPSELLITPQEANRFLTQEPSGLRVTLPNDRDDLAPVVMGTRFGVAGDFDITATLEILAAEQPLEGYGAGATLFINKVNRHSEGATLGRLLRPNGKDVVLWDCTFGKEGGKPKFDADARPCADKRLRLRLKRTGSRLSYHLGTGLEGEKFEDLPAKNFGDDDIAQIVMIVTTGKQPAGVDVRWIDLRIRSDGVHGSTPAVAERPTRRSRVWLLAVSLVALAFLLAAGAYLRRRRGDRWVGRAISQGRH